jgi:hypothetical protein
MSEGLLTDSAVTEEQPTETPSEFANPDLNTEDNLSEDSSSDTEQPESTESPDSNSADSKEGGLRLDDYTRKTQDLADQRRQLEADYQGRIQTSQAQMQEQLNQQKELITALKPANGDDDLISRALANPDLTQEDRIGLSVIQGVQQQNVELAQRVEALSTFLSNLQPAIQQQQQATQQLTEAQQNEQSKFINEQMEEADTLYGADKTNAATDAIRALWKTQNPLTKAPYTIAEIVATVHQIPAKAREEAVTRRSDGRSKAKKKVSTPSQPAQTPQEGELSPREAIELIGGTMP